MWFDDITVAKADGTVLPHQTVVVRDTRIAYVGPDRPAQDEGERVEGSGRLLMPGLVNAHTHVAMTLMRGYGDDLPLDTWPVSYTHLLAHETGRNRVLRLRR